MIQKIFSWFKGGGKKRNKSVSGPYFFPTGDTFTGSVQDSTLLENPVINAIINLIESSVTRADYYILDSKGERINDKTNPVYRLFDRPDEKMDFCDFLKQITYKLLIHGVCYIAYHKGGPGAKKVPRIMNILDNDSIRQINTATGEIHYGTSKVQKIITDYFIVHNYPTQNREGISIISRNGEMEYFSPFRVSKRSIILYDKISRTNEDLSTSVAPYGILTPEFDSTPEETKKLNALVNRRDPSRDGKIIVFTKKSLYQKLDPAASYINLIETLKNAFIEMCNIFNVPAQLLNNEKTQIYNNVREASKSLWRYTVIPYLKTISSAFNLFIGETFTEQATFYFDTSKIEELREDRESEVNSLTKAYFLTINEKRSIFGFPPIDKKEADELRIPGNLVPLDMNDGFDEGISGMPA